MEKIISEKDKNLNMKNDEIRKLTGELSLMKSKIPNLEKDKSNTEKIAEEALNAGNDEIVEMEFKNYPDWKKFEFITRKKGAHGPSKEECLQYYSEK